MAKLAATANTWITAGLTALETQGAVALRAETLARDIGLSKGSFYWHFKDVAAFHAQILATWSAGATERLAEFSSGDTALDRLRKLATLTPSQIDRSVRAWAVHFDPAGRHVQAFDAELLQKIQEDLHNLGAPNPDFATLLHAAFLHPSDDGQAAATLIDLLMVLR